ncbi:MAG: helix-turn-helix domain-containing protein [Muribaculaceae bacterium]
MVDALYIVQHSCFVTTTILMIVLIISRFHVKWINRTYETSRWILVFAMMLLAVHYLLQMALGLRAKSDVVGATVNILFYAPVAILIAYSILHVECNKRNRRRYRAASIVAYIAILAVFGIGYYIKGNLLMPTASHIMLAMLVLYIISAASILVTINIKKREIISQQIGGDIQTYINYTHSAFLILAGSSLMAAFAIHSRSLLLIAAPVFLISLVYFVITFVALGHNLQPMKELFNNEGSDNFSPAAEASHVQPTHQLSDERSCAIAEAIEKWRAEKGFRDSSITITALSNLIRIDRHDLSLHLGQRHNSTFRIWLSELRFNEAKRLMLEHPEFSNEAISAECGFASRAQLYNIFRSKTGMSPKEWKEHNIGSPSCE